MTCPFCNQEEKGVPSHEREPKMPPPLDHIRKHSCENGHHWWTTEEPLVSPPG